MTSITYRYVLGWYVCWVVVVVGVGGQSESNKWMLKLVQMFQVGPMALLVCKGCCGPASACTYCCHSGHHHLDLEEDGSNT
jgi:hypothetical protein